MVADINVVKAFVENHGLTPTPDTVVVKVETQKLAIGRAWDTILGNLALRRIIDFTGRAHRLPWAGDERLLA
jgi:hypothetical protein